MSSAIATGRHVKLSPPHTNFWYPHLNTSTSLPPLLHLGSEDPGRGHAHSPCSCSPEYLKGRTMWPTNQLEGLVSLKAPTWLGRDSHSKAGGKRESSSPFLPWSFPATNVLPNPGHRPAHKHMGRGRLILVYKIIAEIIYALFLCAPYMKQHIVTQ